MSAITPARVGRAAWDTVKLFVTRVLVEPVREGRLRDVGWPVGLRPIVAVGLASYAIAVVLVLASALIRENSDLFVQSGSDAPPIPRAVLWLTMALIAVSVSLGQAGALHASRWARWVVTLFTVLVLLLTSVTDLAELPIARIVAVLAGIGIIVLVAIRGRRSFAWWEFVVIAGLVFGSIAVSIAVVAAASRPFGYDFVPITIGLVLLTLGNLAIPAAISAGAAVTELAVSSAVWAAGVVRARLGRVAMVVLLALVVVWRGFDLAPWVAGAVEAPDFALRTVVGAAVFTALVAGTWVLIARLRRGGDAPTTAGLVGALAVTSLLIAAFITLAIPSGFLQLGGFVVRAFGGPPAVEAFVIGVSVVSSNSVVIAVNRALVGIALIVIAIVLARRGRSMVPELFAAIGIANLVAGGAGALGLPYPWTDDALSVVATLVAIGLAVWMLVTRRVTTGRLAGITGALLLAALFAHRQFLADPLAVIPGMAVFATVLLGFVWALLTGYGAANGESARYPRPARVMLVLANAVFGVTVLAYVALARDPGSSVDLVQFTELGGQVFGDALIVGALVAASWAVVRDRELV